MNELIVVTKQAIGNNEVNAVMAKELYNVLGLNQAHWARWSAMNIVTNTFAIENEDYEVSTIMVKNPNGRPSIDFILNISFAKKLAMQVKSTVGERVRDYFIGMQRKAEKVLNELEYIDYKGNVNDLVFFKDGKGYTNSRIIAEKFEKRHKNVIQTIDNLFKDNAHSEKVSEFNRLNFQPVEYIAGNNELRKSYDMTEQGFSFIALGFTGRKAQEFKIDFINSFFAMRDAYVKRFQAEAVRSVLPECFAKRQFVYIIGNGDNDYIKVGVSKDVEKRLKQLQTGSWSKLSVLYKSMVCSNAFDIERLIHCSFEDKGVNGEWYDVHLDRAICAIENENHTLESSFIKEYYKSDGFQFSRE